MTDDPNADLIGKTITIGNMPFTVHSTWSILPSYVLLKGPLDDIIRPAGLIRRALAADPA